MKKQKKLLAIIMSVVMIFGTVSMTASAAYNAYLDDAIIDQYNSIDKVELVAEQKASLILDKLDVVLDNANIVIDLPLIGTINLTSIDNALNSIYSLTGNWLFGRLTVGDLVVLETHRSDISSVRRTTSDKNDLDVISSLVTYLSKCVPSLVGLVDPDSGFSWGIVKGFLPPEFRVIIDDIAGFVYETVWNALHPVNDEVMPGDTTLDSLVQFLCNNQLGMEEGSTRANIMGFAGVMPGFTLNIAEDSAYRAVEEGIYQALNAFVLPLINNQLKDVITNAVESNAEKGGDLIDIINVNYNIPAYQFDRTKGLADQINAVLGYAVNKMLVPFAQRPEGTPYNFQWQEGNDIDTLTANVKGLLSMIIVAGGEKVFKPYESSLKEIGDYIARVAVEEFVKHMTLPSDATMEEVAYLGLRELCASLIPEYYRKPLADSAQNEDFRAEIIEIAADIGAYFLNNNIGLECDLDTTAEEFITEFLVWCEDFVYGLFDTTKYDEVKEAMAENDPKADGWALLDAVLWEIIPKEWIDYEAMFNDGNGTADNLTFNSLLNYVLDVIFDFDINKLITFFTHNEDGPLAQNVRTVLIDFVSNILNGAFTPPNAESCVPENIETFDDIIDPISNVTTIICNILATLEEKDELQITTLNLVTMLLGLADPQTLGDVDLEIAERINCTSGTVPSGTNLRISNRSNGVNSAWTKPDGTIEQDKMYEIELVSLANTAGLTASVAAGTKIPANGHVNVAVSGNVSETKEVRFDLSYYILDESGERINDGTPLVASVYSHLFTVAGNYEVTTAATGETNKVSFDAFPTYFYTTDVHDVATFSIMATNNGSLFGNAAKDIRRAVITGNLPTGLSANNPADTPIVSLDAASLTVDAYGAVNPYVANVDPDATQPYGEYNLGIQFEICAKGANSGSLSETKNHIIVVYNDFGLPGVLAEMMNANRQREDYLDSATAEWNAYQAAISAGYALTQGNPDHTKMFADVNNKDGSENAYAEAVAAIEAAAEALDLKAKPTDAEMLSELEAVVDTYVSADRDDYLLYSFDRFKNAFDYANGLVNSQVAPEGDTEFVAPSIPLFDLVHAKNQLALWGSRLVVKPVTTFYLAEEVAKAQAYKDNPAVAAELEIAEAYIDDPSSTTQSRVNAARVNLIEAMQGLEGSQVEYLTTAGDAIVDHDNMLIYNIVPESPSIFNFVSVVDSYTAEENLYDYAEYVGTGATVDIIDRLNNVVATYTVVLYGDANGDGYINDGDITAIEDYLSGYDQDKFAVGGVFFKAADVNRDGMINSSDITLIDDYIYGGTIDQN